MSSVTFNVGVNPTSLAIRNPDRNYAYVTNSNNYGIEGSDTVSLLNLQTGLTEKTIRSESFDEPYRISIDDKGYYAYVCNSGTPALKGQSGTLSIIDCDLNEVVGTIDGFDGPGGIVIRGNIAYVTNYGAPGGLTSGFGTTVSVVNLRKRKIIHTIDVDLAPSSLKLSSCGKYLYVTCYVDGNPGTGTLNVISTENFEVLSKISGLSGPFDLSITGNYAYVTNFGSNNFAPYGTTVSLIDLKRKRILRDIEVGIQPAAITSTKKHIYITCYNALYAGSNYTNLTFGEGSLIQISIKTGKISYPAIPVGSGPSGIIYDNDRKLLYITGYPQNVVKGYPLSLFIK